MSIYCPHCGMENRDGSHFCNNCGGRLIDFRVNVPIKKRENSNDEAAETKTEQATKAALDEVTKLAAEQTAETAADTVTEPETESEKESEAAGETAGETVADTDIPSTLEAELIKRFASEPEPEDAAEVNDAAESEEDIRPEPIQGQKAMEESESAIEPELTEEAESAVESDTMKEAEPAVKSVITEEAESAVEADTTEEADLAVESEPTEAEPAEEVKLAAETDTTEVPEQEESDIADLVKADDADEEPSQAEMTEPIAIPSVNLQLEEAVEDYGLPEEEYYSDFEEDAALAEEDKKKAGKGTKIVLLVSEILVAVVLLCGIFFVVGQKGQAPDVIKKYYQELSQKNYGDAYTYLKVPDSDNLSRQKYVNAKSSAENDVSIDSLKIDEIDQSEYEENALHSTDFKGDVVKYYAVSYQSDGAKQNDYIAAIGSKEMFGHSFVLYPAGEWIEHVYISIPENAALMIDGTSVETVSNNDSVSEGSRRMDIPYLFVGGHELKITEAGMKSYHKLWMVGAENKDNTVITLSPSEDTLKSMTNQAASDVKKIIDSALKGEDFSTIASLFTTQASQDDGIKQAYDRLKELKSQDGSSGLSSLRIHDTKVTWQEGQSSDLTFAITALLDKESAAANAIETTKESKNFTATVSYRNIDGEWKLTAMPLTVDQL